VSVTSDEAGSCEVGEGEGRLTDGTRISLSWQQLTCQIPRKILATCCKAQATDIFLYMLSTDFLIKHILDNLFNGVLSVSDVI
jgi:hypothetical protein